MSEIIDPICYKCKHYAGLYGCPAFEDGDIPHEIIESNNHSKPLAGQIIDLVFELKITEKELA